MRDAEREKFLMRRRALYKFTFETPEGREVLADLYDFAGLHRQVHAPGDPFSTAFNDGMRRIALRIHSILSQTDSQIAELTRGPEADEQGYRAETAEDEA